MIDMVRKLQQQQPVNKISKNWRMAWLVGEIGKLLPKIDYLIPSHSRCSGKKPAEWLANWGSRNRGKEIDTESLSQLLPEEQANLQQLLYVNKGGKDRPEVNGQDQAACRSCGERSQRMGTDSAHVGKDDSHWNDRLKQMTG